MTAITRWDPPRRRRALGWAILVALVTSWWFTLAPTAVGGPANYVVVIGGSMEPRWWTGDIVVTRSASSYEVGDIVAMETGAGRAIHRIVGGDAETGFITQGDNRETADGWTTYPDDILGRAWFTAPVSIDQVLRFGPLVAGVFIFALIAWPSKPKRQAAGDRVETDESESSTPEQVAAGSR